VATVIPFHRRVLAHPAFRAGQVHTQLVEEGVFHGG
jgi:acetyl/propionyl-CoA carboxylase alpha subunit